MRTYRAFAAGVSLVAALVLTTASSATASPPGYSITETTVSGQMDEPCNVVTAPDGALWLVTQVGRTLTRFDPKTGARQTVALPVDPIPADQRYQENVDQIKETGVPQSTGPCDMTVAGGSLWFNDPLNNAVGFVPLKPPYTLHEITLPTPNALPVSLDTGADGKVYVTEEAANKIAQVDIRTHQVTEFQVPTPNSGIVGGYPGQDGYEYFVELAAGKLLKFNYLTHAMKEYTIPGTNPEPFVVRVYNGIVYFTLFGANAVGSFNPVTGVWRQATLPTAASGPIGLARGVDGDLYTGESASAKIARIDPRTMTVLAEYPLPAGTYPDETKLGSDGAIYLPQLLSGQLARLWLDCWGTDHGYPGLS